MIHNEDVFIRNCISPSFPISKEIIFASVDVECEIRNLNLKKNPMKMCLETNKRTKLTLFPTWNEIPCRDFGTY